MCATRALKSLGLRGIWFRFASVSILLRVQRRPRELPLTRAEKGRHRALRGQFKGLGGPPDRTSRMRSGKLSAKHPAKPFGKPCGKRPRKPRKAFPEGFPEGSPEYFPGGFAEGFPESFPDRFPGGFPGGFPEEVLKGFPPD